MSVKKFAEDMRTEIEQFQQQGIAAIYCAELVKYLRKIEESPEPTTTLESIEEHKAKLQNWVASNKYHHDSSLELFRSVISSGQNAMKSAFLLNGGAAVAMLAFISHLAEFKAALVPEFANCLLPFVFGVFVISLTYGFTYLSQWFYSSTNQLALKTGFVINIFCMLLGFSSAIFFIWGIYNTYAAFSAYT